MCLQFQVRMWVIRHLESNAPRSRVSLAHLTHNSVIMHTALGYNILDKKLSPTYGKWCWYAIVNNSAPLTCANSTINLA